MITRVDYKILLLTIFHRFWFDLRFSGLMFYVSSVIDISMSYDDLSKLLVLINVSDHVPCLL